MRRIEFTLAETEAAEKSPELLRERHSTKKKVCFGLYKGDQKRKTIKIKAHTQNA